VTYQISTINADSAGGYASVNSKQVYDAIAARLAAQGNWTLVDTVDYVSAPNTDRTFVWKCASPGNGLGADFYVLFTLRFTTATGVWTLPTTAFGCMISICEQYNTGTKVASKLGTQQIGTAVNLAADLTFPLTWTLTAARPVSSSTGWVFWGSPSGGQVLSSAICAISVTGGTFIVFYGATGATTSHLYCGVYDSVMNSTDDPMPITILVDANNLKSDSSGGSTQSFGACTRHPKLTPGGSYTGTHGVGVAPGYHGQGTTWGAGTYNTPSASSLAGSLGDPSNVNSSLFIGGAPIVSRICLTSSGSAQTGSTRGGLRGFLRNLVGCFAPIHSIGDTFVVDSKVYVGAGQTAANAAPFLDTTA